MRGDLLYKTYGNEKDLYLWRTYFQANAYPAMGHYPEKLMITIGRELKPDLTMKDVEKMPEKFRVRFEDERAKTFAESLRDMLVGMYKRTRGLLGINVVNEKDKPFQVFEYMKMEYNKNGLGILEQMIYALSVSHGFMSKKIYDDKRKLLRSEENLLGFVKRGVHMGYDKSSG